jgi:riboflavin synthase
VFTGLVRTTGEIALWRRDAESVRATIACDLDERDIGVGASIACAGVCLTVVESQRGRFAVDVAFETLRCTTLGERAGGERLNLEPSLRVGDALGGHFVSGHVDGVATVRTIAPRGEAREIWIDAPSELLRYVAIKGSVALDGTSLTVNAVDRAGFMVGLVPHTLRATTLGALRVGARLNLEVDMLARYVERLLARGEPAPDGVTLELLADAGFAAPGGGR